MDGTAKRLSGVALAMAVLAAACGDGGDSGSGRAIGDAAISAAEVVATTGPDQQPVDAVPSPDGKVMYYVTTGRQAGTVLRVPAHGGTVSTVADGTPLAKPSGISVTTEGTRLLIADQLAGGSGAILTVPAASTAARPDVLPGTQGRAPRGLDVARGTDGDTIYFTGSNPAGGSPGLFRVPAAGGEVAAVAEGAPFTSPDAVVVAKDGTAYVSDQGAGAGQGLVHRVSGGKAEPVLTGLTLGTPGGLTLVNDDQTLLVSSIDATSRSNQVLFLDLPTGKTAVAQKVIGANRDSSGGLHRAHDAAVLGWADVQRPGRVYRVDL